MASLVSVSQFSYANQCEFISSESSSSFSAKTEHCISVPINSNDPLVIVQGESEGNAYNRFVVEVRSNDSSNSTILDTFTSSGLSSLDTSASASQLGTATLRIKPTSSDRKSSIKVMYGNINGLDTLIIFNKNTSIVPRVIVDEPIQECTTQNSEFTCVQPYTGTPIGDLGSIFGEFSMQSSSMCNINNSSPNMPSTFDLNQSLKNAESYKAQLNSQITMIRNHGDAFEQRNASILETTLKYTWAYNLMNDGHPLDLKAHFGSGTQFENFGNFHYAAYLKAAGFSRSEILSGASFNQAWKDNGSSWGAAWPAFKGWFTQDKDHPHDTVQVERGIKYYDEVYKNDPNPSSKSDSCDLNNGLNKGGNGTGGGGGDTGSGGDGPIDGGDSGSYVKWGCELWRFPDGNGGHYYMERNCKYTWIP